MHKHWLMDTSTATLVAAVVGGLFIVWQQRRHWEELRRDKLRDSYADWIGRLLALRRKDEQIMEVRELAQRECNRRAHMGDEQAVEYMQNGLTEITPEMIRARSEQLSAQQKEDAAFNLILLLDWISWRKLEAQEVRQIEMFEPTPLDGSIQTSEEFDKRSREQEKALGVFVSRMNRALALERYPSYRWDSIERKQHDMDAELKSRLRVSPRI